MRNQGEDLSETQWIVGYHAVMGALEEGRPTDAVWLQKGRRDHRLQRLASAGILRSTRGPAGGFDLGRSAEDLTLLDVWQAVEGPITEQSCLLNKSVCRGRSCALSGLLHNIGQTMRDYLAKTRLSDVAAAFANEATSESDAHRKPVAAPAAP